MSLPVPAVLLLMEVLGLTGQARGGGSFSGLGANLCICGWDTGEICGDRGARGLCATCYKCAHCRSNLHQSDYSASSPTVNVRSALRFFGNIFVSLSVQLPTYVMDNL